jgi:hypothetical protein
MNKQTTTIDTDTPKLFLTDYASYNDGKQFEFGHWIDLTDFSDADEFMEYISTHLAEADKKSPLWGGSKREEPMFTDFENFPRNLYSESLSPKDIEQLYEYITLDEDDKIKAAYLIEQGESIDYSLSSHEDIYLREYDGSNAAKYEIFEEYYPEAEEQERANPYLSIDYDRFIDENFTEYEYNGTSYLVERN